MMPAVELVRALPEQEPVLAQLLELYAHDFSELMELAATHQQGGIPWQVFSFKS